MPAPDRNATGGLLSEHLADYRVPAMPNPTLRRRGPTGQSPKSGSLLIAARKSAVPAVRFSLLSPGHPWQTPKVRRPNDHATKPHSAGPVSSPNSPVSLKVLAEHLGLSIAAVSRVLNAAPAAQSIPKATQDRIFAAAERFSYRPNLSARSLRSRRSQTVGVLVPEVSEGYATLVLSGIEQHLLETGYLHFVVSHRHQPAMIDRALDLLLERSVEGIIAIDTLLPHACPVPAITVSGHGEPEGTTNISLHHRRAAELALSHLHQLGHRSIAIIKGQSFSSDTEARWRAIRHAARKIGLELKPSLVTQLEGDHPTHEPGYHATERLLAVPDRFTAIFAFNDVSAIGAIRAIREAGLRVPEDISVIGFDDVQSAAFQNPALTTIRQPLHDMGVLAARSLLEQIGGHDLPRQIVVDPELIVRGSTAETS